jgi:hypothetical protein
VTGSPSKQHAGLTGERWSRFDLDHQILTIATGSRPALRRELLA